MNGLLRSIARNSFIAVGFALIVAIAFHGSDPEWTRWVKGILNAVILGQLAVAGFWGLDRRRRARLEQREQEAAEPAGFMTMTMGGWVWDPASLVLRAGPRYISGGIAITTGPHLVYMHDSGDALPAPPRLTDAREVRYHEHPQGTPVHEHPDGFVHGGTPEVLRAAWHRCRDSGREKFVTLKPGQAPGLCLDCGSDKWDVSL